MRYRTIGANGPRVSALGLGCMGMSIAYGPASEPEAIRTLDQALASGVTLYDTADAYGRGANEELLGRWLRGRRRQDVVLSTKFGLRHGGDGRVGEVDTSAGYVPVAAEASLRRLGVEHIDLYYAHRRDPETPIEETIGAMAELVRAGKVGHLGLSEVNADTLRRAHAVHPIAAVQVEYSLFTRDVVEGELLATCRELGIGLVAYSPLGRGMLGGGITSRADLDPGDNRLRWPRFAPENLDRNLALVRAVRQVAAEIDRTPAQAALAWLLAQGPDIVPIPGAKRVSHLSENIAAVDIELSADQVRRLRAAVPTEAVAGQRYPEQAMRRIGH
jgi:aryl-alcohol dehydrogenase-like predicted oxidoreductase